MKTAADRDGLWEALLDDRLDVVATDHAPHTMDEKNNPNLIAPSGGPLVQHALQAMLQKVEEGKISIEKVVEKMAHAPADLFRIEGRGYIREGYYADLVVVDPSKSQTVSKDNLIFKCGWSPFEGETFSNVVEATYVNGNCVYHKGLIQETTVGSRLKFNR